MQVTKDNRLGTENITRLMISAGHSFGAGADRKRTL